LSIKEVPTLRLQPKICTATGYLDQAILTPLPARTPGFLLIGRSLRLVEEQEATSARWSSAAGFLSSFFYSQKYSQEQFSSPASNLPLAWYAVVRGKEENQKYE
jgi:hypothetical protein